MQYSGGLKKMDTKTGVYYEYYFNSPTEVPESELITRIAIPVK